MKVLPEGGAVQVSLQLALPPRPAQALQDAVRWVGDFQVRVAVVTNEDAEPLLLGRHQDKLSAISERWHTQRKGVVRKEKTRHIGNVCCVYRIGAPGDGISSSRMPQSLITGQTFRAFVSENAPIIVVVL